MAGDRAPHSDAAPFSWGDELGRLEGQYAVALIKIPGEIDDAGRAWDRLLVDQGQSGSLDAFYSGGRQACLLNMLSSARIHDGPFTQLIKQVFEAWIEALSAVLLDAGLKPDAARRRAERAVIMLQGSLVFSRGMGTTRPFREFLKSLPGELLGGA